MVSPLTTGAAAAGFSSGTGWASRLLPAARPASAMPTASGTNNAILSLLQNMVINILSASAAADVEIDPAAAASIFANRSAERTAAPASPSGTDAWADSASADPSTTVPGASPR